MLSRLLLTSILLLGSTTTLSAAAPSPTGPAQCIAFDAGWNLLAFNYNGKDYNVGDKLDTTTPAVDITSSANRPPFDVDSSSPLCYLSKFTNSIYVLNADASDRSAVYIYDATAKSWSKQKTSSPPSSYDPSVFGGILDHDTNVFYVLSNGEMYSLDMALLKTATDEVIPWNSVLKPQLAPEGNTEPYEPVLTIAKNHIHFLGVPGLQPGTDKIFVIHFSYLQPEVQSYNSDFPTTHGKAVSFFKNEGVQNDYAFIPDDSSNTYVVNVISNTTVRLPGPSTKDQYASYATSPFALVQLASTGGAVQYIDWDQDSRKGTTWKALTALPALTEVSTGRNDTSGNGTTVKGTPGANNTSGGSNTREPAGAIPVGKHTKLILATTTLFMGFFTTVVAFGL